jgi:hypothetical protein
MLLGTLPSCVLLRARERFDSENRMKLANAAPGLTPRAALQSLSAIQMLEVHVPTKDGRTLIMPRHTEPEPQQKLILEKLNLRLPPQPPPRIRHGKLELPAATSSPIL